MLVELSVVEQRYHAVMEVLGGAQVTQVATRYGVSRKTVYAWVGRYREQGLSGLVDRSHRPVSPDRGFLAQAARQNGRPWLSLCPPAQGGGSLGGRVRQAR